MKPDFTQTYLTHHHAIRAYFAKRLWAGHFHQVDDLTAVTFLQAWRGWDRYVDDGKAVSWLRTIAGRVLTDYWRDQQRRHTSQIEPLAAAIDVVSGDTDRELTDAEGADVEILSALPSPHRNVVGLYADGWRTGEIAEMCGINRRSVARRMAVVREQVEGLGLAV